MPIEAGERKEDPFPIIVTDARAVIAHDQQGDGALDPRGHFDETAVRGELAGVAGEVRDDLLDPPPVGEHRPDAGPEVGREPDAAEGGGRKERRQAPLAGLGERDRLEPQAKAARLEPTQLQEVADEGRHSLHDASTAFDELGSDLGVGERPVGKQVQVAAEAGQRRPELVDHRRHEQLALTFPPVELAALDLVGGPPAGGGESRQEVAERRAAGVGPRPPGRRVRRRARGPAGGPSQGRRGAATGRGAARRPQAGSGFPGRRVADGRS